MSDQIDLQFKGELTGEFSQPQVQQNLAKMLKLTPERAAALFVKSTIIKRNADLGDAKRFVQAFKKAGAVLNVVAGEAPAQAAEPVAEVQQPSEPAGEGQSGASASVEAGLDLAPEGTAVLEPHERAKDTAYQGDVPDFAVAEAGENIDPEPKTFVEREFDFGDMSVEPLGEEPPPPTLEPK